MSCKTTNRFWNKEDKKVKVKICGIRSLESAYQASEIGADALGFHMWNHWTKNKIEEYLKVYKFILKFLPPDISCWLVTDIKEPQIISKIIQKINFDTIQIQGFVNRKDFLRLLDTLAFARQQREIKIVKNISLNFANKEDIIKKVEMYSPFVEAILLDSRWKGGRGIRNYDLNFAADLRNSINKPIILAGGLNPENVIEAIQIVSPYGVDVETGVEVLIGYYRREKIKCKSILKIKKFIENVKSCCHKVN
jgi:phosphoribosylanthranilate isomerase